MQTGNKKMEQLIMEIELQINQRLYDSKVIGEEMYRQAREVIVCKQGRGCCGSVHDTQ